MKPETRDAAGELLSPKIIIPVIATGAAVTTLDFLLNPHNGSAYASLQTYKIFHDTVFVYMPVATVALATVMIGAMAWLYYRPGRAARDSNK